MNALPDSIDRSAAEPAPPPPEEAARWRRQYGVAVGLLVGFAALVVAMLLMAGGEDSLWQRRVFVFGAVEALVFTAVGWLFGREVNRSALASAQEDADTAKRETDSAQSRARQEASRAAEAERAAAEADIKVRAVRAAVRTAARPSVGGPQDVGGARPSDSTAVDLRAFIDELLGPDA
jgi:hypothetical protein